MIIGITSDHRGFEIKKELIKELKNKNIEIKDNGCFTPGSCDYSLYGISLAEEVAKKNITYGIAICGTGIGMSIACNKVKGIRAGLCSESFSAKMTRKHNNANVLCLGARVTGIELAKDIVKTFIEEDFEGGRHQKRIDMLEEK